MVTGPSLFLFLIFIFQELGLKFDENFLGVQKLFGVIDGNGIIVALSTSVLLQ